MNLDGLEQFVRESAAQRQARAASRARPFQAGPSLFDVETTFAEAEERAKQKAIERVGDAADPVFIGQALRALYDVCTTRGRDGIFNADDVWQLHDERDGITPRESRAMGAIFSTALLEKWCEPAEDHPWISSRRKNNHRRPLRPWRSLLPR